MAGPVNPGGAEINSNGVEGGFCGSQHHRNGAADGGIHAVLGHQIRAYRQSSAAADGTDQNQHGGFRRNSEEGKYRRYQSAQQFHRSGGPEHINRRQQ